MPIPTPGLDGEEERQLVNALRSGSGSLLVIQAACYWRQSQKRSEACSLLRTLNPVERLARDGVLSQKEAQLSRMFLHVAQGVQ